LIHFRRITFIKLLCPGCIVYYSLNVQGVSFSIPRPLFNRRIGQFHRLLGLATLWNNTGNIQQLTGSYLGVSFSKDTYPGIPGASSSDGFPAGVICTSGGSVIAAWFHPTGQAKGQV
jgi:hypothetical protein